MAIRCAGCGSAGRPLTHTSKSGVELFGRVSLLGEARGAHQAQSHQRGSGTGEIKAKPWFHLESPLWSKCGLEGWHAIYGKERDGHSRFIAGRNPYSSPDLRHPGRRCANRPSDNLIVSAAALYSRSAEVWWDNLSTTTVLPTLSRKSCLWISADLLIAGMEFTSMVHDLTLPPASFTSMVKCTWRILPTDARERTADIGALLGVEFHGKTVISLAGIAAISAGRKLKSQCGRGEVSSRCLPGMRD